MPVALRFHVALQLLLEAHQYAQDLSCDVWQFAVEIQVLKECGLSINDLRWLLHGSYVDQAREHTVDGQHLRDFGPPSGRLLCECSCFVLSPSGILLADAAAIGNDAASIRPADLGSKPGVPTWDKDRRMLWFGEDLVKQFKVPAANQETILAAFEEEGWPVRIDDPLPSHAAIDPKRRLHDTINSLNRNQRVPCLRFIGNGCGEALRWEPVRSSIRKAKAA